MKIYRSTAAVLFSAIFLTASVLPAADTPVRRCSLGQGQWKKVQSKEVGDANSDEGQWLELHVVGSTTTCRVDDDLVLATLLSIDESVLAIQSSSGSMEYLDFYDTATCKRLFTDDYRHSAESWDVTADRVTDKGTCDCDEAGIAQDSCVCWPSRVYRLDATCRPVFLPDESLAKTKAEFGVAFSTTSLVAFPRTPKVKLLGAAPDRP